MTSLEARAQSIGKVLTSNYAANCFDARHTVWGVAYFWDPGSNSFADEVVNSGNEQVITDIIDRAKKVRSVVKPEANVPKSRSEVMHYSLFCLRNREVVTESFLEFITGNTDDLEGIVSDKRLVDEAITLYTQEQERHNLPAQTNFLTFLLHYKPETAFEEGKKPDGVFRNLLERTYLRFGEENIMTNIRQLADPTAYEKMMTLHQKAVILGKVRLDDDLVAAYKRRTGNGNNNGITEEEAPLEAIGLRGVLGRRRIKKGGSTGSFTDWTSLEEREEAKRRASLLIDPNKVLRARLVNHVTGTFFERYRKEGVAALKALEEEAEKAEGEEQKALYTTLKVLQSVHNLGDSPFIKHSMVIQTRN